MEEREAEKREVESVVGEIESTKLLVHEFLLEHLSCPRVAS